MLLAGVFALTVPLRAQIQVGNNLNMSLSGSVSGGYNADYGNLTSSDHSFGVGGAGTLGGYYFNPNFLTFSATPYYNQARDNSTSFSTANSSGVSSEAALFSGSAFPGSVNYSTTYNSQGTFDIPGSANFTTHGNSDSFGVSWSARLNGLPGLSASFQRSSSENSIYGVSGNDHSTSHSFTLNSSYTRFGFNMGGAVFVGGSSSEFPEVFTSGEKTLSASSSDHGFTFSASHRLPWNGTWFGSYNSSTADTSFQNTHTNFTVDYLTTGAEFHPERKLQLFTNLSYSSNLSGSIEDVVLESGGVVQQSTPSAPSHSLEFTSGASYTPISHMFVQGDFERRTESFLGESFGSNLYSAGANYYHLLLGGSISSALSAVESTVDNNPAKTFGFTVSSTYNREILGWHVNSSFNYEQGVESLLVTYTTSAYGFGGGIKRKWQNGIIWTAGVGLSRTGLTGQSGNTSSNNSYSSGLSLGRWASLAASYSTSTGNGLLAANGGIVTPPIGIPLPTTSVVLYGGTSYSYSIGSSPIHRLTLSASYSRGDTNTGSGPSGTTNTSETINTIIQYQFRKMDVSAGYSRLTQGFSASGTVPQTVTAYYINISRWFKFF